MVLARHCHRRSYRARWLDYLHDRALTELKEMNDHKMKMQERKARQVSRIGSSVPMLPMKNDPHWPHSHARENARRLKQRQKIK